MTQSKATRSIIDTHRHIFGPKLRQKFVENIGFDDSKPLPQANAGEMFFYRESVDVDYSMEIQQKSGVTLCVNSYGGEIETFAKNIIKASTIDTLKFLHDESFELRDRFPKDIACMANAHALEENTRDVIDPLISNKQACCISISFQLRGRCRSDLSRLAQSRMAVGVRAGQGCSRSYSSAPGIDRRCCHAAVQA
jgi:hypothetical protein